MVKKRLATLRIQYKNKAGLGISQKQLAEKLGCSPSTIAMYETGERTPPLERAIEIAKIFGVKVEDIIFRSPAHDMRAQDPKTKAI